VDDASVARELDKAREAAMRCFAHDAEQQRLGVWLEAPEPTIQEISRPLRLLLAAHPEFGAGRNCFFGGKQMMLHPQFLAPAALRVAGQHDASAAIRWLHKIYAVEVTDVRVVAEVYGLQLTTPRKLKNGLMLQPLAELRSSPNAMTIASQWRIRPGGYHPPSFYPPVAATLDVCAVSATTGHETGRTLTDAKFAELSRTVKALTLADAAAPVIGISWIDFVDSDLVSAEVGQITQGANFEGALNRISAVEINDAGWQWVDHYLELKSDVRAVCDIAIDRLNLARRRISPGDKAIDGAICLESLLGDDDSNELTYKLKLRAALLLGSTLEERREIRDAVGKFYKLRSSTVHGRLPRARNAKDENTCVATGLGICLRALRTIIERNEKPAVADWELNGGLLSMRSEKSDTI
jgi:hypothetical protein